MQHSVERAQALLRGGDPHAALKVVSRLGLSAAGVPELVPALAHALYVGGDPRSARKLARDALREAPESADLHSLVGNVHLSDGDPSAAEPCFRTAIRLDPEWDWPHLRLADALRRLGRAAEAIAVLRGLAQRRDSLPLRQRLCELHLATGSPAAALVQARRALAMDADDPASAELLGRALLAAGDAATAAEVLAAVVADRPQDPMSRLFLARALRADGRMAEAQAAIAGAARRPGASAALVLEFADLARRAGRPADAEAAVTAAVGAGGDDPELLRAQAELRRQAGDFAGAAASFAVLCRQRPDDLLCRLQRRMNFPAVIDDEAEIDAVRRDLAETLDAIDARAFETGEPLQRFELTPFYLAYHDRDDRDLNSRFSRAFRTLFRGQLAAAQRAADQARPATAAGRRPRIGIVSSFLRSHTIARLNELLIRHLGDTGQQVVLIRGRAADDAMARRLDGAAAEHHVLPPDPAAAAATVAGLGLDTLFYPELGMEPLVYALAHLRLAPSQVTTWGHPSSSGIETVDWFLSSARFEPADAAARYSETLVRFDDANMYFDLAAQRRELERSPGTGDADGPPTFGCLQSAFKFHPAFDRQLRALLACDPSFRLCLIEDPLGGHMSGRLRRRLQSTLGPQMAQVAFLPPMPRPQFLAACREMTCMLDIPSFSGGNTTLEALMLEKPVVTLPSSYLKGRLTAGMYAQMGIDALTAADAEDYVEIAARLAGEAAFRADMRAALRHRLDRLMPSAAHLDAVAAFFAERSRSA